MKKFFIIIAFAASLCCLSSCYHEEIDTFVEWGFAKDTNSNITNGLETLLPSATVIFEAFDKAFYSDYTNPGLSGHEALMRAQSGKNSAIKNAKRTADKAHSSIAAGHTCPADYIFVVRIKYNSDSYETVWSHDYRPQ